MTRSIGKLPSEGRLREVPSQGASMGVVRLEESSSVDRLREHAVLLRAGTRDEVAVREIYRTHVARVHRHVARILGTNDADIEDVVQQTFMAAIDGATRFDGRSAVSTWLMGIATRRALDHLRARGRRTRWRKMGEAFGLGRAEQRPDETHSMRSEAQRTLEQLKPELRLIFVLCEVEGYTLAEASELTGVALSTLHARLSAARKKLDLLTGDIEGDDHG